jgi:hypothetical protein
MRVFRQANEYGSLKPWLSVTLPSEVALYFFEIPVRGPIRRKDSFFVHEPQHATIRSAALLSISNPSAFEVMVLLHS